MSQKNLMDGLQSPSISLIDEQSARWEGVFTKETIPTIDREIKTMLGRESHLTVIDLSKVSRCDSALVALMVECQRQKRGVVFTNHPEKLQDLLSIYGVASLFDKE